MMLLRFNVRAWVALTLLVCNSLLVKADLLSGLRGVEGLDDNNTRDLAQNIGRCESGCVNHNDCEVSSEGYTFVLLSTQGSPVEYLLGWFEMQKAQYQSEKGPRRLQLRHH
jgi:hypothetical protein